MPFSLVIQDSDDSDAELSDIATSIDPLQNNTTTANPAITLRGFPPIDQYEQHASNNNSNYNNQVVGETTIGNGNGAESNSNNHGPPSFDPNLSVNFDQFLASQSQDQAETGSVSLSQQQRERAWLGEEDGDGAYSSLMQAPRRSILKRGRTIDVRKNEVENVSGGERNVKRRRTMDASGAFQDAVGKRVGFAAGSPEQDEDGCGVREELSTDRMIDTDASLSPEKDGGDGTFGEDLASEAPNTPSDHPSAAETVWEPPLTPGSDARSRKQPTGRSKSTQGFDDTAYDTEPMSSITLARAHRTMSSPFISHPPPSSTESTRDELSLPPVVQVAITNMRPTAISKNEPSAAESTGMESDRDELDCINADFGGMPKERYKPRPSRSRSKAIVIDTGLGVDEVGDSENPHVEVAVPREDSTIAQTCQSREDGDSTVAEISNNPEEFMLNPTTQDTPLEGSKRQLKVAKKRKVKRGKTTSVMLKRAVESDVEDDVIWVDEKPADVIFKDTSQETQPPKGRKARRREESDREPLSNNTGSAPEVTALKAKTEDESHVELDEVQPLPLGHTTDTAAPDPAPAPKKRGRKRKKTSESLTMEPPISIAETEPSTDDKKEIQPLVEQDQNIPALKEALEEKDFKPDTVTDIGPAAEVDQVTQFNEEEQKKPISADTLTSAPHSKSPQPQSQPSIITTPAPEPVETPTKPPMITQRGPDKHSPITVNKKVSYRVGLSRTAKIAPLLKVVRK
ncbi:uncharacterized protein BDCG_04588 [Blastomyces dermatitidis ER-3]|uniref:AT DNA binding protein n=1 Tax=Ajellomyces dermatitidis (strain ER-3 / ATCC MYA-2586) TaxID=559297 RepID=A0ABP2F2N0_AJEDR|nr:uncharacterized protein BDCG_04588 [Blastomyces dermatitidis ER-3]EEQ89468.1 hypothetical protein BDCG_04588 [Blastomyces dermatitidis ER-3]EQL28379.1 hypothetical protein BDFG_08862 [Blastomyces dermatitidis ATCC 26199]